MIATLIIALALGILLYICLDIITNGRLGTTISNWIGCTFNQHMPEDADHTIGAQAGRVKCRRCGTEFEL